MQARDSGAPGLGVGLVRWDLESTAERTGDATALDQPGARPHATAVLAGLMDFPGSMKVAELLERPSSGRARHPHAAELGLRLQRDVEARLEALQRNATAPLCGPRAPRLPTAEALLDAYRTTGPATASDDAAALDAFGAITSKPLLSALSASFRQSQVQIGTLRFEIQDALRQLGPDAERLERLDAALHAATHARVRELFSRVEKSLADTWSLACAHALTSVPEAPELACFAAWAAPDGWLGRFHDRCLRAAVAMYEHLRRNLTGFVRAAVTLETT